ncbi:NADase-type glycan-binding domain-containing protein [Treponema sp.]|uniref:NADase-type glycan-binding domain-containing protein n=1 Tax=Treponema sp. TaxID=166 RepID=UPI003EFD39E3
MADFLESTYCDKTVANEDYKNFKLHRIQQTVYAKQESKEIYKIVALQYRHHGIAEGNMETGGCEYFVFNDLLIKELNKDEIGFFITEASIGYQITSKDQKIIYSYAKTKNQMEGLNSCDFFRAGNREDFYKVFSDSNRRIRIDASEYLFDSRCPLKYSIQNAFDGNPATSYVENTEDDLFDLEIQGLKDFNVIGLMLINGYAKNTNLYHENNRLADYQYNSKEKERIINNLKLKDNCLDYQVFDYCFPNNPHTITSGITKVYHGSKYNDTCLAEINIICRNNSFLFGDINE